MTLSLGVVVHDTEVQVFTPAVSGRVRVLIRYTDLWRAILWMRVRNDGSVYFGPPFKEISTYRKGSMPLTEGRVPVDLSPAPELTDSIDLAQVKISAHGSGLVRAGGDRFWTQSLRTLGRRVLLCQFVCQHPATYAEVKAIRRWDVLIDFPLERDRPLYGSIHVSPLSGETDPTGQVVAHSDAIAQYSLLFRYEGLSKSQDLLLQINLCHGPRAEWGREMVFLWDHIAESRSESH